jgi:hypothetical protein
MHTRECGRTSPNLESCRLTRRSTGRPPAGYRPRVGRRLACCVRHRTVERYLRIEKHNHANHAYRRRHPAYACRNCLVLSGYECPTRQLYDGANAMGDLRCDRVSHRYLCVLARAAHFPKIVTAVNAANTTILASVPHSSGACAVPLPNIALNRTPAGGLAPGRRSPVSLLR